MPELPELDAMQEVLTDRIVGRTIASVSAVYPNILKTVSPPLEALAGCRVTGISRRAKHLIFSMADEYYLIMHLMVAGRLILCQADTKITKATGLMITFEDGQDLRIIENATTKRAAVHVVKDPMDVDRIAQAGVEPLSDAFTVSFLQSYITSRKRQIKKLLTDQRSIAGIGAAYADEILFDARLSPIKYGTTVTHEEIARLHTSVQRVLRHATDQIRSKAGGAALTPHGRDFVKIYKKTNQPCPECGTKIAEIRYAQTKTYYCPTCQASGASLKDRRSWLSR